jgi:gamma-D-glutamyl-L-lysine dipeptidyl-peptidase
MTRIIFPIWLFFYIVILTTTGCAGQIKETNGITRVGYAIQVGAFSNVKNAERLASRLQDKGIDAFYFKRENGYYAVRFGDYRSKELAVRSARDLVNAKIIDSYFIAPPISAPASDKKEPIGDPPPKRNSSRDMGTIAARTAERFVGIPYQWGGCNVVDGMDCSGFVRAVYNLCGVNIPRTSREQFKTGDTVMRQSLKEGDLVFFGATENSINHVGIYVGNSRFVHAPRRGDEIKISSMEDKYFTKNFVGARRYF